MTIPTGLDMSELCFSNNVEHTTRAIETLMGKRRLHRLGSIGQMLVDQCIKETGCQQQFSSSLTFKRVEMFKTLDDERYGENGGSASDRHYKASSRAQHSEHLSDRDGRPGKVQKCEQRKNDIEGFV